MAAAGSRVEGAVARFAQAAAGAGHGMPLRAALQSIAEASASATSAELAVVCILDPSDGRLAATAVAARSRTRAAEIEGTRLPLEEIAVKEVDSLAELPAAVRRLAERSRTEAVLQLPVLLGNGPVATLELLRAAGRFTASEIALARLAAAQIGLCLRAFEVRPVGVGPAEVSELAGEALSVAAHESDPDRLAAVAAVAWGAGGAVLWRREGEDDPLTALGAWGLEDDRREGVRRLAEEALAVGSTVVVERETAGLPAGVAASAVAPLGRPALGALQLLFAPGRAPSDAELSRLGTFGAHAARALRAAERVRALALELNRSRALLGVLGQAIAELSLAHTVTTALDRIGALLAVDRLAVYLKEGDALLAAAGHGLAGPHTVVAERLLEITLGPARARGPLVVADARRDRRLEGVRQALEETAIEAALAVPLVANEEVIGLLAAYPAGSRRLDEDELGLLSALAGQLAVAVQNARLHERAKELGAKLEQALAAESAKRRSLEAVYEVSRSFTQSLSLEATLEAVSRASVESLGVDAAVLRVPDARGEALVTQALHVADPRLERALSAMLSHAQVISRPALQRLFRRGQALRLDSRRARALGGSFALLEPFLEKGSTAVVIPVATPSEVLATLTLISLDPTLPIDATTIDAALSLAAQAALAIENARLYQQQKQFADTMQRSLLPRVWPTVPGVELGIVYESSARMDVGGDVYDFMSLEDGRLAIVIGDVTGHGIDAAADMAMAKFVFRSLAREHPEPGAFLAHANDVVAEEIASGKFITLVYLVVDPRRWEVACAAGGHPAPRLVAPDGSVEELAAGGLALGIEPRQAYDEVRRRLEPGAAVVLYTDGVVEARTNSELYGVERLDAVLSGKHALPVQELAEAVIEDCRRFGHGELLDDCAVVVIRRTP
jgi:serine phosphatase RsbU (regulator of sigma subunit)